MRKYVGFLFIVLFVISCKKKQITPGNYSESTPQETTTNWQSQYSNGGTLPNWNNNSDSELKNTKWVLTKMVSGFSTSYPNDTIEFVTNTQYSINSGSLRNYVLTSSVASTNKTLSLYYFYPFGGSHYSGEVGQTFVSDGVMDNIEFKNIQNTTSKIRAWFVKI